MDVALRRPAWRDAALALLFAVAAEVELRDSSQNILAGSAPLAVDSVLVLLPLVPLAWRSRHPFAVVIAMIATFTVVGSALHGTITFFGGFFAFLVSIYSASGSARRPWDRIALPAALLFFVSMPLYVRQNFNGSTDLLFATVLAVGVWLAGQAARRWREQTHELTGALAELELARALQAEHALTEERTRIARELHDVVAHGLSVVVLQAQAARLELREHPEKAVAMISAVEAAGREALAEMRRLLGLLRSSEPAALEPAPGLGSLPELVARLGRAGLETQVSGEAGALPTSLDLTTYRIVQESLTNALRHAEPRFAELQFHRTSDSLRLTVTSPLSEPFGSRLSGTGHGLDGIRERALAVGGQASSGVRGDDFVVDVCLPLEGWAS